MKKAIYISVFYIVVVVLLMSCSGRVPISVHHKNPHYFEYNGKPLVLITTDQHYGAVINLDFDYIPFLDRLHEYEMNLTRIYPGGYVEMKDQYTRGNPLGPAPDRYILPWKKSLTTSADTNLENTNMILTNGMMRILNVSKTLSGRLMSEILSSKSHFSMACTLTGGWLSHYTTLTIFRE